MISQFCTKRQLQSSEFNYWATLFGTLRGSGTHLHRKVWEWCFIAQALSSSGVLKAGKKGLGFAVGEEPLTSAFAMYGATIIATDLDPQSASAKGWIETSQHATNIEKLNKKKICPDVRFRELCSFEFCDMNNIPEKYNGDFDFIWSSCALEHLGSLEHGKDFILNSLRLLRRGGIAVHTTEFNVSSNFETITSGETVLYRRSDIESIINAVTETGCKMDIDWNYGGDDLDYFVDIPPYSHNPHLKLRIGDFTGTSVALVMYKP